MNRFVLLMASIAITAVLNGCSGKGSASDAPPDFTAIPGDGVVTLAWTAAPDVEYWLFYASGSAVTTSNWSSIGGKAVINAIDVNGLNWRYYRSGACTKSFCNSFILECFF